jgi:preprotein translocase subunit YajC
MSFLIPAAYADTAAPAAAAAPGGDMMSILMLVGFMVIFYLMIWRPQAKRAKEHKNLLGGLQKGDEVVTSGGIIGKVTKVTDDFVVVEISDNVELKFQKQAIAATLPKGTLKSI